MLALLYTRNAFFFSKLKVDKFSIEDYKTMCFLLKQKVPVFNEMIVLGQDVKLMDL